MDKYEAKKVCMDHMHRYVRVWTNDGYVYDGIVESVDDDVLNLAVPVTHGTMATHAANVGPEVNVGPAHANIGPNMGPNVGPNVAPNMHPNVAPNMHPNVAPNMHPNVAPNMHPNVGPNVGPNVDYGYGHGHGYGHGGHDGYGYPFEPRGFFPGYGYGYGYPGFGYGSPFGYGYGFGYPFGIRRFNRLVLPLAALTALSVLPYY